MTQLLQAYCQATKTGDIEPDDSQMAVIRFLDDLLVQVNKPKKSRFFWQKQSIVQGLYIHGSVGVGKTFLMDLFFEHLPKDIGARYHFHHFMQQVDAQLRQRQGQRDPLKKLAKELSQRTRIVCFDEFMVHDIAHAMILTELFHSLFEQGLILVATSNTLPDQLYPEGIQRQRFLPAIELIKQHCQMITLVARRDYRLNRTPLPTAWYHPVNLDSEQAMLQQFSTLQSPSKETILMIQNRQIPCKRLAVEAVWFDFNQVCYLPRSQLDYLELANRFKQIFVSNIPQLGPQQTAEAILFVYFIDIMYDYGVRLVLSSQVEIDDLCTNAEISREFNRTQSRLKEMQSLDYARRHQHRHIEDMDKTEHD